MTGNKYFAVKGINEDSFGYDFITYKWKGVIQESPTAYKMVELDGDRGVEAHQSARRNKVLLPEDFTGMGNIADAGGAQYRVMSPAMGTEPKRSKDTKGEVITGDKKKKKKDKK